MLQRQFYNILSPNMQLIEVFLRPSLIAGNVREPFQERLIKPRLLDTTTDTRTIRCSIFLTSSLKSFALSSECPLCVTAVGASAV